MLPTSPDLTEDYHVHTRYCRHASGEMEEYVLSGIEKGLGKLTFLEHMEEGIRGRQVTWLSDAEIREYFLEGRRLQTRYAEAITIELGVECGFNINCVAALNRRLASYPWDNIGVSCHFLELTPDSEHLNLFSRRREHVDRALKYDLQMLFSRYLENLTEAVSNLPGTILCHLDGALRYVPGLDLTDGHYSRIETLLDLVKDKNMAVELNTSGIDIRGEMFPGKRIRSMISDRKIKTVLGSDAHRPENVGNHFAEISLL